ncbi:MAG TPA: hypothetical protein VGA73_01970 [Candidatus Binatia bacterium]
MNPWQLIFLQSRANHGWYDGDRLPPQVWAWPQGTWLQNRLRHLREEQKETGGPVSAGAAVRENGGRAKNEARPENFSLVPLLIAEAGIPDEARRALLEGRRRDAAALLRQTYGLDCSDAAELAGVSAC